VTGIPTQVLRFYPHPLPRVLCATLLWVTLLDCQYTDYTALSGRMTDDLEGSDSGLIDIFEDWVKPRKI
jgi:hypothetical protein